MFYNKTIMNSDLLGKAWKVAHNMNEGNADTDLPAMCNKINMWASSESIEVRKRLSLRTSSSLACGAAKIFKSGIGELFKDLEKLNENMIYRKRRCPDPCTDNTSVRPDSPEIMRGHPGEKLDASPILIHCKKKRRTKSPILPSAHIRTTNGTLTFDRCHSVTKTKDNRNSTRRHKRGSVKKKLLKKDQAVQTMFEDTIDQNLPFGYFLIHDSYMSRTPSMILLTSLDIDVTKLKI